ncbi:MAG TPA: hypothetical protein DCR04_05745 [Flavobacteriales bacterium]|jgi:hypothetical protein|nr:hypothetical protein [Flavobacteriales bacterium]
MKFKVLTYSIWLNVLLFALVILTYSKASKSLAGYQRVIVANEQLNVKYSDVLDINGRIVGQNQVLELKNQELEALIPELHKDIKALQVKPSRVESVSASSFSSHTNVRTVLRDSTVFDTVLVKHFSYEDEFCQIEGFAVNDTQHLNISYQDTLIQTVYRGKRKKPWLWIFSPRQLEQRVALKNPDATINYSQHIQILQ